MSTEKSDTKLFDEKEQPAEIFPETESNSQTPLSSAHANNINTNQLQDVLIPLTSTPRTHGNNKDSTKDLHTVDIFEHKTLNVFQEFLSFLDEKIKNETTSHLTKHDKNIRPRQNQTPETQPNPNTQSSPSNQNIQDKMMLKLTNIQRQIERMRRVKNKQNQQQLHKKPEIRTCFRCGKLGHVAKFCRSKPSSLYKISTNAYSSPKSHLKQTLSRSRSHTKSYPNMPTTSKYDPLCNWQVPDLHSNNPFSAQNQTLRHKHKITQSSPQQLYSSPGSQST